MVNTNVDNDWNFKIDDRFKIKGIGVVSSAVVENGFMWVGEKLYLGRFKDGTFKLVIINKNIHNLLFIIIILDKSTKYRWITKKTTIIYYIYLKGE